MFLILLSPLRAKMWRKETKSDEGMLKSLDVIGGMEMATFEYFATNSIRNKKAFISSSKMVLIDHVTYGFVNNYAKVRIYDDNTIRIIAKYLAPNTNEVKMDESFYTIINNGKNNWGA